LSRADWQASLSTVEASGNLALEADPRMVEASSNLALETLGCGLLIGRWARTTLELEAAVGEVFVFLVRCILGIEIDTFLYS
jgi:hypothetical protein